MSIGPLTKLASEKALTDPILAGLNEQYDVPTRTTDDYTCAELGCYSCARVGEEIAQLS